MPGVIRETERGKHNAFVLLACFFFLNLEGSLAGLGSSLCNTDRIHAVSRLVPAPKRLAICKPSEISIVPLFDCWVKDTIGLLLLAEGGSVSPEPGCWFADD